MIIYFDKKTGRIIQTVQDRMHNPALERTKPTGSGIEPGNTGILIIKFVPTKPNAAYKADVEPEQEKFVYELERTGKITDFKVIDNKIIKSPQEDSSDAIKTVIVDLRPSEDEILSKFSTDIQDEIKQAEQELVFKVGTHLDRTKFLEIFEEMRLSKNLNITANHYFENMNHFIKWRLIMYFAENQSGEALAGAMVLPTRIANYQAAATTLEGREKYAGFFLLWNVIKDLKSLDFKLLNLGGVYNENTETPLEEDKKNINLYKQKWGGVGVTERQLGKLQLNELTFDSLA